MNRSILLSLCVLLAVVATAIEAAPQREKRQFFGDFDGVSYYRSIDHGVLIAFATGQQFSGFNQGFGGFNQGFGGFNQGFNGGFNQGFNGGGFGGFGSGEFFG
ncbi:hypothetical protein DAPPUDRAFT_235891 [Daphnia pulex]|uniref:Uncharacterized protein n=1 Tax=Daphnia pulex TaxID=6669 RepID=E9FZB9_DAPPU|nr:hypothetical protein DAPPUDRAFT_235891 [Daphnia pulex]|eukprot:EFX87024.1 hypothetical protein DAPPUDRAFT_235891 [Daphnia pulex]